MVKGTRGDVHLPVRPAVQLVTGVLAGCLVWVVGCDEPALDEICPDISEGELVLTELRGNQNASNRSGQWVEIFNASGRTLELVGLQVRVRKNDGSAPSGDFPGLILIRESLIVEAGHRVVVGSGDPRDPPASTDYPAAGDFEGNMPDSGLVDLLACDAVIDLVNYDAIPDVGTLALDGAIEPDASSNDLPANFCVDDRLTQDPTAGNEAPGSPGEANPPCDDSSM